MYDLLEVRVARVVQTEVPLFKLRRKLRQNAGAPVAGSIHHKSISRR